MGSVFVEVFSYLKSVMPLVGGAVYATVLGFAKEPLLLDVCRMVKQRIRIK